MVLCNFNIILYKVVIQLDENCRKPHYSEYSSSSQNNFYMEDVMVVEFAQ